MMMAWVRWAAGASLVALSGCQFDPGWSGTVETPDQQVFEDEVYPILLRDCAFSECHGAERRFLRVVGPGRSRLEGSPSDPELLRSERLLSYERTRSMLTTDPGQPLTESLLFRKPLDVRAGGAAHEGVDVFGRDPFQTSADPRYQTILAWAEGVRFVALPTGTPASGSPP